MAIERVGASYKEQAKAVFIEEFSGDSLAIFLGFIASPPTVRMGQGGEFIYFPTPKMMREIATMLNEGAGMWERGELGIKAPE